MSVRRGWELEAGRMDEDVWVERAVLQVLMTIHSGYLSTNNVAPVVVIKYFQPVNYKILVI